MFPFLMPRFTGGRSQRCERCGLRYARNEETCPHCRDLDDSELEEFLDDLARQREGGRNLGWFLLLGSGALLGLVVVLLLAL